MDTIALCIPAYNAELFLPRLLISAKAQRIPFDEIWIYDDCSSDNTAGVAAEYGANIVTGEVNSGCSIGKNILAAKTSCGWIHFHDADDELMPNFTTLAHQWISRPDCPDVVLFDYEWKDNDTKAILGVRIFDKAQLERDPIMYAVKNQINPFCGLYRKTSFHKAGGYDTDPLILYNEDQAFHIRLAVNGLSFSAENEVSIINYQIRNSMSASNRQKCIIAHYHVLQKIAATHGTEYCTVIASEMWDTIATLASIKEWRYVKNALKICNELGHKHPLNGGRIFRSLAFINPFMATWIREKLIRRFKPNLRTGQ